MAGKIAQAGNTDKPHHGNKDGLLSNRDGLLSNDKKDGALKSVHKILSNFDEELAPIDDYGGCCVL